MKKIVRLSENDLMRLVKKVLLEDGYGYVTSDLKDCKIDIDNSFNSRNNSRNVARALSKRAPVETTGVFLCPNGTYRNGTDADGFQSG